RLTVPINPSTNIKCQTWMYLPSILSEPAHIMTCTFPERIVESLPIEEGEVQIKILQRGHWDPSSRSACRRRERWSICRGHCQSNGICCAGDELIFACEPRIVLEIVMYRTIRAAELECVVAVDPGHRIFKLQTPL